MSPRRRRSYRDGENTCWVAAEPFSRDGRPSKIATEYPTHRMAPRFTDAWATARERLAKIAARGNIVTVAKHIPLVYFTVTGYGGAAMIIGPDDLHEYVELPALTTEGLRDRSEEVISKGVDHIEKRLRARAQPPFPSTEREEQDAAAWAALQTADVIPRWLWDVAMGPLLDRGLPLSRMMIVPGGPLAVWPLHAAWTADEKSPTGRRYALDESCITYAFNARLLIARRKAALQQVADKILISRRRQHVGLVDWNRGPCGEHSRTRRK